MAGFAGDGQPLPGPSRAWLGLVLGAPPPDVRIHDDRSAADLARAESAFAVTRGTDIAFATGAYRPGTPVGDILLAHEVAHAMQQNRSVVTASDHGRSDRTLERQADIVAYRAALALFDPVQAAALAPPRVSVGTPLRLARCAMPEPPDLQGLPSREAYEGQGRLLPRAFGSIDEPPPGVQVFRLGPREPELPDPFAAVPETLGSRTPELPVEELLTRLSAIDFRQTRIDELTKSLDGGDRPEIAHMSILFARSTVERPGAEVFTLGPVDQRLMVPNDRAGMTREIVRADAVQRRALAALIDLNGQRSAEEAEGSQLKDYDTAPALAKIDAVRRRYRDASSVILAPVQVERLNAAIREHRGLGRELMSLKLGHFEQRTAEGSEIQDAVHEINGWASELRSDLELLANEADAAAAARDAKSGDAPRARRAVARHAQLVSLSIEALGEWESAVRAYEMLHASPAGGWGGRAIRQVAWRMGQMHDAYRDRDTDYLRLLVRDHQGDPRVTEFYAQVPNAIVYSKMVVGFAVMVIAAIATAGVGLVVDLVAAGVGLAEASYIVIGAKMVAEAVTFTLVSRAMLSAIPGMAPESGVWADLIWNLGLFGVLRGANAAVKAALLLEKASVAMTAVGLRATEFAVLEAYGTVRFAWENRSRDPVMTADQFGMMTAQNVVMMAGMAVVMKPIEPLVKTVSEGSFAYFRARYRGKFAEIEASREALTQEIANALQRQGPPEAGAISRAREEGAVLNDYLTSLVEEAAADPKVDIPSLRGEVAGLRSEVAATPIDELLGQGGLDPTVDVRTGGDAQSASYAAGETRPLVDFLEGQGDVVGEVVERPDGSHVFESNVAGKGDVVFVERRARDPSQSESRSSEGAGARTPVKLDRAQLRDIVHEVARDLQRRPDVKKQRAAIREMPGTAENPKYIQQGAGVLAAHEAPQTRSGGGVGSSRSKGSTTETEQTMTSQVSKTGGNVGRQTRTGTYPEMASEIRVVLDETGLTDEQFAQDFREYIQTHEPSYELRPHVDLLNRLEGLMFGHEGARSIAGGTVFGPMAIELVAEGGNFQTFDLLFSSFEGRATGGRGAFPMSMKNAESAARDLADLGPEGIKRLPAARRRNAQELLRREEGLAEAWVRNRFGTTKFSSREAAKQQIEELLLQFYGLEQ